MQIKSRKELKSVINYEKSIYIPSPFKERLLFFFTENERGLIFRYLKYLRHEEYFSAKSGFLLFLKFFYARKRNRLGNRINIKIQPGFTGKGLNIHHKGIIINGHVGENCIFHGNNCIGNNIRNENERELLPDIKNRVEFGYGSIVIGDVTIENDVRIGAGAVVVKDILTAGATAVGIPAKTI